MMTLRIRIIRKYSFQIRTLWSVIFISSTLHCMSTLNPECPHQCQCVPNRMNCEIPGLQQLPVPYLPQLEYLLVENQTFQITHLGPNELVMYKSPEYGGQVRLKSLFIRSCNIQTIGKRAFEALGSHLETLDLSGNPLISIGAYAFAGLGHLTLILDHVKQPLLDDHSFSGLSRMKSLLMRYSEMTVLPYEPLLQLTINKRLDRLLLQGNKLQQLDQKYDRIFEGLETFEINLNPWHCDCSLTWLIRRYRSMLERRTQSHQQRLLQRGLSVEMEEEVQPRCATPLGLYERNFTDLITDIDVTYSYPDSIFGPQTVMYCPPPQLESLEFNLESYIHPTNKPVVFVQCFIKGSKHLKVSWRSHIGEIDDKHVSNMKTATIMQSLSHNRNALSTQSDQSIYTKSSIRIEKSGPIDTYSCLGEDIIGNVSTLFRIKWPSKPPMYSSTSTALTVIPVKPTSTDSVVLAEAAYFDFHAPQYSLSELLAAVIGTICFTVLVFFIVHWLRNYEICRCVKSVPHQLDKHQPVNNELSPAGTSSSNTSSNVKLIFSQPLAYPSHILSNDVASTVATSQMSQSNMYHPYCSGTLILNQPPLSLQLSGGQQSEMSTDTNMSSSAAYEPVAYSDANHLSATYDAPWLATNVRRPVMLQNSEQQHIPLLYNHHADAGAVELASASFFQSALNIPPPPSIPQPLLPTNTDSINSQYNSSLFNQVEPVSISTQRTQLGYTPTSVNVIQSGLLRSDGNRFIPS